MFGFLSRRPIMVARDRSRVVIDYPNSQDALVAVQRLFRHDDEYFLGSNYRLEVATLSGYYRTMRVAGRRGPLGREFALTVKNVTVGVECSSAMDVAAMLVRLGFGRNNGDFDGLYGTITTPTASPEWESHYTIHMEPNLG